MTAKQAKPDTPTKVILGVLLYEFSPADHAKSEKTIKKRLRYYRLGPYEPNRVALLRRLKDSLQDEIGRYQNSQYYVPSGGRFADLADFDVEQMVTDYQATFPEVEVSDIRWFIPWALYAYYLR